MIELKKIPYAEINKELIGYSFSKEGNLHEVLKDSELIGYLDFKEEINGNFYIEMIEILNSKKGEGLGTEAVNFLLDLPNVTSISGCVYPSENAYYFWNSLNAEFLNYDDYLYECAEALDIDADDVSFEEMVDLFINSGIDLIFKVVK